MKFRNRREPKFSRLRGRVKNFDDYDIIMLGYPNWWASISMPIASFLESYDFTGKIIMPFCSHGGGRLKQHGLLIINSLTASKNKKILRICL